MYHCNYVTEGKKKPPKEILNNPEIAEYVKDWGRVGNEGFMTALRENQQPIGAAWYRLFQESNLRYKYVDDKTPELSIAVLPQYRCKRVGQSLMIQLLKQASSRSYRQVSLSVEPGNPAVELYQKLGFERVGCSGTSWVMIIDLK